MKYYFSQLLVTVVLLFACAGMASAAETPETYIVQKDDILSRIAYRFHTTWPKLAKINKLKNPNRIYPGNVLIFRETEVKNTEVTQRQKVSMAKQATVQKPRTCDPMNAITQLEFPKIIEQNLRDVIRNGQFEEITSEGMVHPIERARKYVAYDGDKKYAFIYPEKGCAWRLKLVETLPPDKNTLLEIPPLPPDRNENAKLLALPLGPTPGNVDTIKLESPKRSSELIVLVRYLNNCTAEKNCVAHEAKGGLFVQRE